MSGSTDLRSRRTAMVLLLATLAPMVGNSQEGPSAEPRWDAVVKCASIGDSDRRHTCTDEVLRSAGVLSTDTPAEHRESFGLAPKPDPAVQVAQKKPKEVDVILARVAQGGDGKLVLTTTEGAIWRQVESEAIHPMPKEGESMKIQNAALGGFLCSLAKSAAFRCYRTR